MKIISFISIITLLSLCSARAQLTDNFSDSNFTLNPVWMGNDTDFIVNSTQQLQLNSSGVYTSYLVTSNSNSLNNCEWHFWLRENFSPSDNNRARVYLVSDQQDITSPLNGYFLQFGENLSNDQVELFRQTGTVTSSVCRGTTLISSAFSIGIKVIRDSIGQWSLFIDPAGGFNYALEATGTDATFDTTAWFGALCKYTTSYATNFYFDDFYIGPILSDTVPPSIASVSAISAAQLDIQFSEPIEKSSSENILNYAVNNGIGNPLAALRDNSDSSMVHLTLGVSLVNGTTYQVTVSSVQDNSGNVLVSASKTFTWFIYVPPVFKDVLLNEIMADPDPPVLLPDAEYLELYNASDNVFDLNGWLISDASTSVALSSYILKPKQYVILCAASNAPLFQPYGNVIGLSSLPSLNNTGDIIILQDNNLAFIDSVRYSDNWYNNDIKKGGGWSLELINPNTSCSTSNNWKASADFNGGTPGQQNSVFDTLPETVPPAIISISVTSPSQVLVNFSEPLDTATLSNATITVSNGLTILNVQFSTTAFNTLQVSFTTSLDTGIFYSLSITNIADCSGNWVGANNTGQFVIAYKPQYGEVVINEIFADPSPLVGLPAAEFVELFNATTRVLDLSGSDFAGATLGGGTYLPAGGFLILCNQPDVSLFSGSGQVLGLSSLSDGALTNAGEELMLKDASGNILDKVTYSDSWYGDNTKKNGGWTLERINPYTSCNFRNNWIASSDPSGGTPGKINSQYNSAPDVQPPGVWVVYVYSANLIEVVFDEPMDSLSVLNGIYTFSNGMSGTVLAISDSLEFSSVLLLLGTQLAPKTFYTVSVSGVKDCPGNFIGTDNTGQFILPEKADSADLIINEALFNPRPFGFDFVEIYNNSNKYIDLMGWQMANVENDSIVNFEKIISRQRLIFPGEYLVVTEDSANVKKEYPLSRYGAFIQMNLPTYSDDTGNVVLSDNFSQVIDRFNYSEKMQFPLLTAFDGISLERLDFNRPADDVTNWHSAAESAGWATPGYKNSQYNSTETSQDPVQVSPEVFSPDNDGYNDVLNISYKLDAPGFLGNITAYDAKGRLIRYIARNELLAIEGVISWDGTTEEKEKARIGIYIVNFEIFNLKGDVKQYKKTCVVGGKL